MVVVDLFSDRCGATQSGNLDSSNDEALDGILGFGKSNSSVLSQLASSGQVKNMFAHCLDGKNGGGIFAIGHVIQPEVNMTPLVPNQYVILFLVSAILFILMRYFGDLLVFVIVFASSSWMVT